MESDIEHPGRRSIEWWNRFPAEQNLNGMQSGKQEQKLLLGFCLMSIEALAEKQKNCHVTTMKSDCGREMFWGEWPLILFWRSKKNPFQHLMNSMFNVKKRQEENNVWTKQWEWQCLSKQKWIQTVQAGSPGLKWAASWFSHFPRHCLFVACKNCWVRLCHFWSPNWEVASDWSSL